MSRVLTTRRALLVGGLVAFAGMGCNPATLYFLMRGDDKVKPEIPLPAKEGKKEVTVVILANGSPSLSYDFAGAERELVALVAQKMMTETKEDKHPIRVIEQAKVDKFKAANPSWQTLSGGAVGKQLGADYVIDLTLTSMSMYQPEYGKEFYQGRASLQVVVYDTATPDKPLQDYVHNSMEEPRSTAADSPAGYRRRYIAKVAQEVAYRHIPHVTASHLPTR
jgi:hypothetical protein